VETAKVDDFHFHDTRHHFASWYVMRGGSPPALQQILGHATLAMTMRYSHLSPKHLRDEMVKRPAGRAVRPTESTEVRTQDRAHEGVEQALVLQESA
jgi:integrase